MSQAISAVSKRLRMTRASVSYDTFRLHHSWRISNVSMQPTRKVFQGGSFAAPTSNLFVCEGTWVRYLLTDLVKDRHIWPKSAYFKVPYRIWLPHIWRISAVLHLFRRIFECSEYPVSRYWVSIAQICYILDGGLKPTISLPYPLPLKQHGLRRAPLDHPPECLLMAIARQLVSGCESYLVNPLSCRENQSSLRFLVATPYRPC
jgi:hypothetical protein